MKILISCQNQVEMDVTLQYQFVRAQKICKFDTHMHFSELHQTRLWPLKYFEEYIMDCEIFGIKVW